MNTVSHDVPLKDWMMLRFPNPGSTITNFVEVYGAAFRRLYGRVFNLDSMVEAVVEENLATSSGYMGAEAISRSTRKDRSRDPLYNQLKMYAELFRALGWIHPTEQSALNFTHTLLGRQVAEAKQHHLPLLGETVLGISHPSHILGIRGDHDLRPFAFLLLTMLACDDGLSRDEMIVGPLSAGSDRSDNAVPEVAATIEALRAEPENIRVALTMVASEQNVQVNTLRNYTRWPIAVMRDLGWTEKARRSFRSGGRPFEVHRLTETGRKVAEGALASVDLRLDQVDRLPFEEKAAVSVHAHYRMLERAGFDLESVNAKLKQQEQALSRALALLGIPPERPILFSPFQSLSIADIRMIFPAPAPAVSVEQRQAVTTATAVGRGSRDHLFIEPRFVTQLREDGYDDGTELERELRAIRGVYPSAKLAAAAFAQSRESDTQTEFYPLVSELFRLLGFESENSRAGVNYQRWDSWVDLDGTVVPVEIKSSTEERALSTKAIRQALENKVVLLARRGLETTEDATTLIVGYQIPNERGEMSSLIDDVFEAFDIRIGVMDLPTLALLAIRAVTERLMVDADQLRALRGFLYV